MDDLNEKELNEATLDGVTGGDYEYKGPMGVYRCVVCGWEIPGEHPPYPQMFPCKKCGGRLMWHQTSGPQ